MKEKCNFLRQVNVCFVALLAYKGVYLSSNCWKSRTSLRILDIYTVVCPVMELLLCVSAGFTLLLNNASIVPCNKRLFFKNKFCWAKYTRHLETFWKKDTYPTVNYMVCCKNHCWYSILKLVCAPILGRKWYFVSSF